MASDGASAGRGKHKPFPFVDAEFSEWMGAFSPDGRWLAYMSDESGKQEVYVQTFTGVRRDSRRCGKVVSSRRTAAAVLDGRGTGKKIIALLRGRNADGGGCDEWR